MNGPIRLVIAPDSFGGALDSVVEILTRAGRPLPLAKLIVVPPSWTRAPDMPPAHKDMFISLGSVSEQWDGPAAIAATDGCQNLRRRRNLAFDDRCVVLGKKFGLIGVHDVLPVL